MPALESFDWYLQQVSPQLGEEVRKYLEAQRRYLLTLRNEDERRRFVANVIQQVKEMQNKEA
jgi:hypothetical protein